MKDAFIFVDMQNDFCPGGALAVENGDQVIEVANFISNNIAGVMVATQDWHPASHKSFRSNNDVPDDEVVGLLNGVPQIWWPDHAVQGTKGSEFHPNLDLNPVHAIFRKGMNYKIDSYSAFFDNKAIIDGQEVRASTGLDAYLKGLGVVNTYILGLATDYCVKWTAEDSAALGFNTHLVLDGCRGVNLNPDDSDKAVAELEKVGVTILNSSELL